MDQQNPVKPFILPSAASQALLLVDAVSQTGFPNWFPKPEGCGSASRNIPQLLLSSNPPYDQLASLYFCSTRCIFIVRLPWKIYEVSRLSV